MSLPSGCSGGHRNFMDFALCFRCKEIILKRSRQTADDINEKYIDRIVELKNEIKELVQEGRKLSCNCIIHIGGECKHKKFEKILEKLGY